MDTVVRDSSNVSVVSWCPKWLCTSITSGSYGTIQWWMEAVRLSWPEKRYSKQIRAIPYVLSPKTMVFDVFPIKKHQKNSELHFFVSHPKPPGILFHDFGDLAQNQSGMALNGLHGINHQPFPKVEVDVNGCRNGIKLGKPRILLAEYPAEHQHWSQSLIFRYLQHDHVISNIWILAGYYVNKSENVTTTHSRPWFSFQACFTQCIVWIPAR